MPTNANLSQQPGMDRAMHDFFQAGGDAWAPRTGQPQEFDPAAPTGGMSGMSLMPFPPVSARVRPTRAFLIDDFLPRSLTDSYSQLTAQGAYQFAVDPTSGTFSLVPDVRIGQPKSSKVRCPNLAVFWRPIRLLAPSLLPWEPPIRWNMTCTRPTCYQLAKRWAFDDVLNLDRGFAAGNGRQIPLLGKLTKSFGHLCLHCSHSWGSEHFCPRCPVFSWGGP